MKRIGLLGTMVAVVLGWGLLLAPSIDARSKAPKGKASIWEIYVDGKPASWVSYQPNPQFAIYDKSGDSDPAYPDTLDDDVVLDRSTGLQWQRDGEAYRSTELSWNDAVSVRNFGFFAGAGGWRLPTAEELHNFLFSVAAYENPFINMDRCFWSQTTDPTDSSQAISMSKGLGVALHLLAKSDTCHMMRVRGGNGYATGGW